MSEPPPPARPIRFGIADFIAVLILGNLQGAVLLHLLRVNANAMDFESRTLTGLFLSAVFIMGAAYLTHRLATETQLKSFWGRVFLLVLIDIALISCYGILVVGTFLYGWREGRLKKLAATSGAPQASES